MNVLTFECVAGGIFQNCKHCSEFIAVNHQHACCNHKNAILN